MPLKIYGTEIPLMEMPSLYERLRNLAAQDEGLSQWRELKSLDQCRSFIGHLLLMVAAWEFGRWAPRHQHLRTNGYGKPFLKAPQGKPAFKFNLSHSGKWVVLIMGAHEVGIDVEEMQPVDVKIVKHFFSEAEKTAFFARPIHAQVETFYELWTFKESYLKMLGVGLSQDLASFTIALHNGSAQMQGADVACHFKEYDLDPDYKLAVCGMSHEFPEHLEIVSLEWLLTTIEERVMKKDD